MSSDYYERMIKNHIKIQKDGRKVFFPQGPLGLRGYIIDSDEIEKELRKAIITLTNIIMVCCGPIGLLSATLFKHLALFSVLVFIGGLVIATWLLVHLYFYRFTKRMKRA